MHEKLHYEPQGHEPANTLIRVATDLQAQGTLTHNDDDTADPRLDPSSPQFDHFRWAQIALQSLSRDRILLQRQGVVFSELSVTGAGATLHYQETVLSTFTLPFRKLAELMAGSNRPTARRRILDRFDGLLQSDELLLVLGRPGSGCTTFLKTICQHMAGLRLEPKSNLHYEGISAEQMTTQYRGDLSTYCQYQRRRQLCARC